MDPFECRPLSLVDADRPAVGELLKVGRGDHVFSAIVEPRPGTFGMGLGDDAQGAVHEPRAVSSIIYLMRYGITLQHV